MPSRLTVLLATPAGIFWLWLVIVPARGSAWCPDECQCDTARYKVSCHSPSITTVPLIRLTNVTIFELYDNNITLFERDSFVSLIELEVLSVWRCGLRTIELGAFNGLSKLTGLDIWYNVISEIIPGTFENLNNLESLGLGYNRLEHLDSDVFSGLVNLKYIDLEGNKLQYLHPDTFLGLPNIQHISLYNNTGLQIPTDSYLINSHSLSSLDITVCNLSSLSVETFANVSALEWLDLRYNNLRTVAINMLTALPKLSGLLLDGNRLQCDCQLQEVWRWCEDRNITTGYRREVPECDTPSEVKGMGWGVLEKEQCLQVDIEYYGDCNNTSCSYTDINDTYTDTQTDTDMDTEQNGNVSSFLTKYQVAVYAVPFILYLHGLL
jgi:hypothetical protein